MQLLMVRHAVAEDRRSFAETGRDDAERPLTKQGRRAFSRAARAIGRLLPALDLVASSPLERAAQTARILADVCGAGRVVHVESLGPRVDPRAAVRWLRGQRRRSVVAIVGHEPHLSRLAGLLLAGASRRVLSLEKGGACLIDVGTMPKAGAGTLRWLMPAAPWGRSGVR
jgi:phosphohistidine phosphatase